MLKQAFGARYWWTGVLALGLMPAWLLHTRPKVEGEAHELFDTPFYNRFRALVNACVRHRWITLALTLALFGGGIVALGKVQQQFFPDSSRPAALQLATHHLAFYALELAASFHAFYRDCRVISSDPEDADLSCARLRLVAATKTVFARVLGLMGVSAPESM